jgi:hypothetical protein
MKSKQRFKGFQPDLRKATETELFTELMKRVTSKNKSACFFIDTVNSYPKWSIHDAYHNIKILADKF